MLVTKIVIAHVAKSKCKLSIWTAVEWSNAPAISKGESFFFVCVVVGSYSVP